MVKRGAALSHQFVPEAIRGIPSGGWSLPRLVSAACTGLILETSRTVVHHRGASSVPWTPRVRSCHQWLDVLVYSSTSVRLCLFLYPPTFVVFIIPKFPLKLTN